MYDIAGFLFFLYTSRERSQRVNGVTGEGERTWKRKKEKNVVERGGADET